MGHSEVSAVGGDLRAERPDTIAHAINYSLTHSSGVASAIVGHDDPKIQAKASARTLNPAVSRGAT